MATCTYKKFWPRFIKPIQFYSFQLQSYCVDSCCFQVSPTPKAVPSRPGGGVPEPERPPSSSASSSARPVIPKANPLTGNPYKRRKSEEGAGELVEDKGIDPNLLHEDVKDEKWEDGMDDQGVYWEKDPYQPEVWWFKKEGCSWGRWRPPAVS